VTYEVAAGRSASDLTGGMRAILASGEPSYGGWCMIPSAFCAEIVSASGCGWMVIDQQHGLIGDEDMRLMVQAAAIRRTPVLVRVAWNEPAAIMRALDAGADGVVVPMVNDVAEAERAARASHYPPIGYRSWGPLRSLMALPSFGPRVGNEQAVCFVMIETVEGFDNLDAILDVPGVDGALVGPNDLRISHTGDNAGAASAAEDVAMIERIGAACRERGLAAAMSGVDLGEAKRWVQAGFNLISVPSDAALVGEGMARALRLAAGD